MIIATSMAINQKTPTKIGSIDFQKKQMMYCHNLPQICRNPKSCRMATNRDNLRHFKCHKLAVDFENAFPPANAQEIESVQIYFFFDIDDLGP